MNYHGNIYNSKILYIMEVNSISELKEALNNNNFPITTKNEKVKGIILKMAAKKKDKVYFTDEKGNTINEAICTKTNLSHFGMGVISETVIVTLIIMSYITIISLYAIYKKKNIKVTICPDGSIRLETSDERS